MLWRMLRQSWGRNLRRKVLAIITVFLASSLISALLAVSIDIGDKMSRELKSYGANILIEPAGQAALPALFSESSNPLSGQDFLDEAELPNIKDIFWRNNIVGFAPMLGGEASVEGEPVRILGTFFSQPVDIPDEEGYETGSQVVAEGLGLAIPHSALAPSGEPVWREIARASARAALNLSQKGITTREILTDKAIENAMTVHAAFGGSTNLLLHIPAIAHQAGCHIPTVDDWIRINKRVPRLVSVLPNGPVYHPTVNAFMAGGVPEVMLHLRSLGLLHEDVMTVTGSTLKENLDWWEHSERRQRFKQLLLDQEQINADEVIMSPQQAKARGLTSTITFPVGNIAPEGSVIKSTAIDPSMIDEQGIYYHKGVAKVYLSEKSAIYDIKHDKIKAGDILVIIGVGPSGTGMEETYQVTSALKHLSYGKHVSLITDARFSGVSTGACIGHVGPEALAGGPIGKLRTGDVIEIKIDCRELHGEVNFLGTRSDEQLPSQEEATAILNARPSHQDLLPDPELPDDTQLWAMLQAVSGGTWTGCIYDVNKIGAALRDFMNKN